MKRRLTSLAAPALLLGLLGSAAHAQATLSINGQTSAVVELGGVANVNITGPAGQPGVLFLDVSPGPVTILGQSVPLGFTPVVAFLNVTLSPGGSVNLPFNMPWSPKVHGATIYFWAATADPGSPSGLAFANGADVTLTARPDLAGNSLANYPHFEHVRAYNRGSSVELGVDTRYGGVAGNTADVYVVASKTTSEWASDPSLSDARGAAQTVTFPAGATSIQQNTFTLDTGTLAGPDESAGSGDTRIGVGYDVVIDFGQDGMFDDGVDLIDGFDDTEAGMYVVRDTEAGSTKGSPGAGPYAVTEIIYSGGTWLGQDTYYPTSIASMGQLPLVVVSHGNGHNYQWYDHFGYHLASYGYIVMSHTNLTGPGSHTAAGTTFSNTDYLINNQGTIGGGVLSGHIDTNRIVWIGHSRGADGVARAYDQIFRGAFTPQNYTKDDLKLVSSIAPVDFGGWSGQAPALGGNGNGSHPHDATFHLWVAQADADVNGCAQSGAGVQWYHLHDRGTHIRMSTSLYGVGHGDYHDGGGSSVASGPNLIGRTRTHEIVRGILLPLVHHYAQGDVPSRDFLWRQYESFHAIGSPTGPNFVANLMFQDELASGKYVIDDFQDIQEGGPTPAVASSGATVTRTVPSYVEDRCYDNTNGHTWVASDPFNGFTYDFRRTTATQRAFRSNSFASVFSVDGGGDYHITYDLTTASTQPNFWQYQYLSFRAAQGTHHPLTIAELADVTFTVTLEDGSGNQSSINIGAYGGGVEDPYQRSAGFCGTGTGWNSEFETIRIRLADFLNSGSGVNFNDITKVIFQFGPSWGSSQARLGLDEIELTTL